MSKRRHLRSGASDAESGDQRERKSDGNSNLAFRIATGRSLGGSLENLGLCYFSKILAIIPLSS